jgi:hypothetical protein
MAIDDWLLVYSTATWNGTDALGEVVQIHTLAAPTVTLNYPLEAGYAQTDTSSTREITPVAGVKFEDVTFIASDSASGNGNMIDAQYVEDFQVQGCRFESVKGVAISVRTGIDTVIEDNVFEESSATGASVYATSGSRNVRIRDNTFTRVVTGIGVNVNTAYQTRWVDITGNEFHGVTQAVLVDECSQYVTIDNNDIIGNTSGASGTGDGIEVLGPDFTITNNRIREAGGNGILTDSDTVTYNSGKPWSALVANNRIYEVDNDGINIDATSGPDLDAMVVSGNLVVDPEKDGIDVKGDNITIIGNIVNTPEDNGINVATANDISIVGNTVMGVTTANDNVINMNDIDRATVIGNVFSRADDLDTNVYVDTSTTIALIGNTLTNGTYGIELASTTPAQTVIRDNVIDGMATASFKGTGYAHHGAGVDGPQELKLLRVTYDPASDSNVRSVATHSMEETLPNNAIVINCYYVVHTTFESGAGNDAATIGIGISNDDVNGIVAAIAISDGTNPWDSASGALSGDGCIQDGTVGNASEVTTAARTIDFTVANEAIDAGTGKLVLYLEYLVTD